MADEFCSKLNFSTPPANFLHKQVELFEGYNHVINSTNNRATPRNETKQIKTIKEKSEAKTEILHFHEVFDKMPQRKVLEFNKKALP